MLSHFGVIDKMTVAPVRQNEPVLAMEFVVVSVWERSADDRADEDFEFEVLFHLPDDNTIPASSSAFRFERERHRILVNFKGFLPFASESPGKLVVENRIRRKGHTDWWSQNYSILVAFPSQDENRQEQAQTEATSG